MNKEEIEEIDENMKTAFLDYLKQQKGENYVESLGYKKLSLDSILEVAPEAFDDFMHSIVKCRFIESNGERCINMSIDGSIFCNEHKEGFWKKAFWKRLFRHKRGGGL